MKFLNVLMAVMFAAFAWLQRNDIDPEIYYQASSLDSLLWFLFYFVIAAAFIVLCFRGLPTWYFVLSVAACFVEMAMSGPGLWENLFGERDFSMTQVSMSGDDPRVELTREFFGAVLALAGVGFQWWQSRRRGGVAAER